MFTVIKRLLVGISQLSKHKLFSVILLVTLLVAVTTTVAIYRLFLDRDKLPPVHIALVAPLSGDKADLGQAMLEGMRLKATEVNRNGGIGGHELNILTFDDGNNPEQAKAAAAKAAASDAIAVVSGTNLATISAAEPVFAESKIGAITLAADLKQRDIPKQSIAGRMLVSEDYEARFLANYIRNVIGEKTVHILYEDTPRGDSLATAFDETMQRFGTRVVYRWAITPDSQNLANQVSAAAKQLNDGKLPGTILIIADATTSARALIGLRMAALHNPIAGTRSCSTDAFINTLRKEWKGPTSVEAALNGTILSAPMLFDVAGEAAQNFRTDFIGRFLHSPDWVAAYANDAMQVVVNALDTAIADGHHSDKALRLNIFQQLSNTTTALQQNAAIPNNGVNGPILLNAKDKELNTPLIGVYNGLDLISTTTQLVPIREEGLSNLLQQFMEGRAIYVNDRFMYRTNVVYTGIQPAGITSFDDRNKTIEGDFLLWFRWRGDLAPEDVVFTNAVTPVHLETPDHEEKTQDTTYRIYRVHGKFFMNFANVKHAFDTMLVGVSFHHRLLSRHNLMYVNDVLGMGMTRDTTLHTLLQASRATVAMREQAAGLSSLLLQPLYAISRFLHAGTDNSDPLVNIISRSNVLAGAPGWVIEKAWISQDIEPRSSRGDPNYVGFGRPSPEFSHIELGIILKPDLIRARDIITTKDFWYVAIFAAIGALLAFSLDKQYGIQFWRVQTFFLRLTCWPLLLASLGNIAMDNAVIYASANVTGAIWLIYNILNWLLPAWLIVIAFNTFMWMPLEAKTKRKIPGIIRLLAGSTIFIFAFFGIVAYVFEGNVTSLLAASGLGAMVIGLAIRDSIANVLSGIILNVEKPFAIGDKVQLSIARGTPIRGKVIDVTWRATQIEHELGHIVTIPNGKLSETEIHNLASTRSGFLCDLKVYVDPAWDQDKVLPLIKAAIAGNPHILVRGDSAPSAVTLLGMENVGDVWKAVYRVRSYVKGSPDGKPVCVKLGDIFWKNLFKSFQAAGYHWSQNPATLLAAPCDEENI